MSLVSLRVARVSAIGCIVSVISFGACGGGSTNNAGNPGSNADGGNTNPGADGATSNVDSGYVAPNIDAGVATAPGPICVAPISAVDVSTPTTVVGSGAGTCTEDLLAAAIAKGGIVTFNCGGKATIPITKEIAFPKIDTTLDGGNMITLDGGGATRLLSFNGGNYRTTTTLITVQNIALQNAKASGTAFAPASPPCPQGTNTDGGGGAILFNDGKLHVINVDFTNDAAAPLGPDVAGGAIYVTGSLEAIVVNSTFTNNTASNGGAIGSLNSQLDVYNSGFAGSKALGNGANYAGSSCVCAANKNAECGSGGNGGTISIDGGDDTSHTFCGDTFIGAEGGSGGFGGAIFRTPDGAKQPTTIDRCTFDSNSIDGAGGAMYFHNSTLTILASTISNNTSNNGAGGIWVDGTTIDFENVTIANNGTNVGLGAGLLLSGGNDGALKNVTIAGNHIDGVPTKTASYFGAGIGGGDTITLENSIVAYNTDHDPYNPVACFFNPETGANDIQYPQAVPGGGNDKPCVAAPIYSDPLLGALANNGGPTLTMLPKTGSPAIGAGSSATCTTTDQTGKTRKMPCTLGAVEAQ